MYKSPCVQCNYINVLEQALGCVACVNRLLLVAPLFNSSDEGLLVPLIRWKHVGAVMDAKNSHFVCVFQILKELHTLYTQLLLSPSLACNKVQHQLVSTLYFTTCYIESVNETQSYLP